jgi:hypothetical protein
MKTFIFEVKLLGHGNVARTIEIPEAFSLYRLAEAVLAHSVLTSITHSVLSTLTRELAISLRPKGSMTCSPI